MDKEQFNRSIGNQIMKIRMQKHLTREHLAEAAGISSDQDAGESAKKNQILREVSDCDEYEMNIIYDTVLHLKKSLRKNRQ